MTTTPDQLQSVMSALVTAFEADTVTAYAEFSKTPAAIRANSAAETGHFDAFYFALQYPASQLVDGLLNTKFPGQYAIQFLFKNSQFVERHLRHFIEHYEGTGCGADKTHTIMRGILKHLQSGEEIVFNRSQEYTYHLPKKVFTQHATIMQFFEGLRALYSGDPEPYLMAIMALQASVRSEPA